MPERDASELEESLETLRKRLRKRSEEASHLATADAKFAERFEEFVATNGDDLRGFLRVSNGRAARLRVLDDDLVADLAEVVRVLEAWQRGQEEIACGSQ